jgi:L-gulonolactone oxidase
MLLFFFGAIRPSHLVIVSYKNLPLLRTKKCTAPPQMSDPSSLSTQSLYQALEKVTIPASSPDATFTNWARTFVCNPSAIFEPRTVDQCALIFELARREGKTVRAVGVGHSPSDLACTTEFMLRTTKLDKILHVSSLLD